jgi:hypothetical protein
VGVRETLSLGVAVNSAKTTASCRIAPKRIRFIDQDLGTKFGIAHQDHLGATPLGSGSHRVHRRRGNDSM